MTWWQPATGSTLRATEPQRQLPGTSRPQRPRPAGGHRPVRAADRGIHPEPGEVIFADAAKVVSARRWCWRQSAQSATGETTVDALVIVEGQHEDAASDVASAVADLVSLLAAYQPGSRATSYLLSPTNPRAVDP